MRRAVDVKAVLDAVTVVVVVMIIIIRIVDCTQEGRNLLIPRLARFPNKTNAYQQK